MGICLSEIDEHIRFRLSSPAPAGNWFNKPQVERSFSDANRLYDELNSGAQGPISTEGM